MMKTVIILPYPYPIDNKLRTGLIGGLQTQAKYMIDYLRNRIDIKVLSLGNNYTYLNKQIRYFGNYMCDREKGIREILREVKKSPPDNLFLFLTRSAAIGEQFKLLNSLPKFTDVTVQITRTDYIDTFSEEEILILKGCRIIAQSDVQEKLLLKRGIVPQDIIVVGNPVDLSEFTPSSQEDKVKLRKTYGINADDKVILSTSRLIRDKGIQVLFDALEILSEGLIITCLVVGVDDKDGEGSQFVKRAEALSTQGNLTVKVLGKKDIVEMPRFYQISDVFTLTSRTEGLSNSLMEAMASKIPIIATDIDANKVLLKDNYSGLLYRYSDVTNLANGIRKLLIKKGLGEMLVENAFETIQNYSSEKILPKYLYIINDI